MTERNAEQTRERILLASFEEMYLHGYQGMRIDSILEKTKLAKGALYHHFPNKKSIGYAVVDEILFTKLQSDLTKYFNNQLDPISANCKFLKESSACITEKQVAQGCPINNLSQEMASLDEGFKERLCTIYEYWVSTIANSLAFGIKENIVRQDVAPEKTAMFILSSLQGIIGSAKCMQSKTSLLEMIEILCSYIESLRQSAPTQNQTPD